MISILILQPDSLFVDDIQLKLHAGKVKEAAILAVLSGFVPKVQVYCQMSARQITNYLAE